VPDLLTPDDLAYMRETQDDARPTIVTHWPRAVTRTPGGGTESTHTQGRAVRVRIDAAPDEVPQTLADRYQGGTLCKIVCPLGLDVRDGDQFRHAGTLPETTTTITTTYEVVTDGEQDTWATAQIVWARRLNRPARG
jgi:hypothetical protein